MEWSKVKDDKWVSHEKKPTWGVLEVGETHLHHCRSTTLVKTFLHIFNTHLELPMLSSTTFPPRQEG